MKFPSFFKFFKMSKEEIADTIKIAEKEARRAQKQGKQTVDELSPHIGDVENSVSNLNYEFKAT